MVELVAPAAHAEFQYHDPRHQSQTALSGMWLFLATEVLFFGGLVFVWLIYHRMHPAGFKAAAEHSNLLIGSINTAVLVTSSAVFTWGVDASKLERNDKILRACAITVLLGLTFLALKGYEWYDDFNQHLVPGAGFGIAGPDRGGAQIFYVIYYIATVLHALHMAIGVGLVSWIGWNARRGAYSREWHTPVQVVGLYWSFVDIVWLTFYPLIYVIGRT
jgi:cytochrome c oxidase subunit 3